MSRQTLSVENVCQHLELDEYFSPSRGEIRLTYVCHHPDHDGCLCVLNGVSVAECKHSQEGDRIKTVRL